MKNTIWYFLTVLLLFCGLSGWLGYTLHKPAVLYIDVPRTEIDTVYVKQEIVKYKWIAAKHDTVFKTFTKIVTDTACINPNQVSYMDTTLRSTTTTYGHLSVAYYPYPWDKFNMQFEPAPLPQITITKFVDKKRPWYAHPAVALCVGVVAGVSAGALTK